MLVVPAPVVGDGGVQRFQCGRTGAVVGRQSENTVDVRSGKAGRDRLPGQARGTEPLRRNLQARRRLPGTAGEAEHVPGNAQAVGDPLDHIHVHQLPPSRHHFADAARGEIAPPRDHRRVDARPGLHEPEDRAEIPASARVDHCRVRQQTGRKLR